MTKSALRCAVYDPPEPTMPYIALIITPQGDKRIETFPTRKAADEYIEKRTASYVGKFSVIGRGLDSPVSETD